MRVRLNESAEKSKLSGKLAKDFSKAVRIGDIERTIRYSMLLLERSKSFFPDDDSMRIDADALMDEFDACENDVECVNARLDSLWDFCDEYGIIIDDGDEDDDEIFIDAPKGIEVEVEDDKKKKGE